MPNRLCGDYGFLTKAGQPCRFILPDGENACQHHSADQTRRQRVLERAEKARREAKIHHIETNGFASLEDCLRVKARIVEIAGKDEALDFRRLELMLKCATSASGDHATKAQEKQNELLLALDGHGAGIAILNRLKEAPVRVLPGRRKVLDLKVEDIDVTPIKTEEAS